ncbi:acyl transferase/acyl hydrolase/lysophospholipase [Hypoxylon sp. FL0890]|nr:acyl transferase/acyl hydrolase/lysophospholipase [Hypoxylon sp. FL0890]
MGKSSQSDGIKYLRYGTSILSHIPTSIRFHSDPGDKFEGKKFKSQHDLLRFLEDGDVIAVRLCAQFPAWEIHARKGRLIIEMSQTEIHREAPKYAPYVTEMKAMERIFVEVNEVTQPKEMGSFIPRLPLALFRADAFDTGDERPLRVLSLDGGGVRGLASLHILNAVMKKASPGKKPCEVFDMIGGTSTGGLIAIMLGRLKMTVDECIQTYQELMGDIFCGSKYLGYLWRGDFYSAENIEKAIKKLIKQRIDDEEAPLIDEDSKCKIFVTATFEHAANNRGPLILRSYTNKQVKSELPTIKLWQAARATSAAPAYFKPIDVDGYKLVDGGLGANNPLGWLWTEVLSVFGPVRKTDCFLSIGTGIEANKAVEQPGRVPTFGTIRSYACIATNAELTHILFRGLIDAFAPRPRTPKYWRLNVSKEIPAWDETKKKWVFWSEKVHHHADYEDMIELDDTSGARSKLMDMTKEYLSRKDVEESIKACAEALRAHLA